MPNRPRRRARASTLAAFLVVIVVYNHIGSDEMSNYGGLAKRSPFLAMVLAAAFFSPALDEVLSVHGGGRLTLAVAGRVCRCRQPRVALPLPAMAQGGLHRRSAGVTSEPDSLLDQHMPIPPLSGTAGPGAQASGELTLSTISRV